MQDLKSIQIDQINVLSAGDKHVPAVVRIAADSHLSHWSSEDYLLETRRLDSIFLVGEVPSGDVIGFIVGRIIPGPFGRESITSEIYNIGVISDLRRSGVGSKLLSSYLGIAGRHTVRQVTLEVRSKNTEAQNFYVSHGFKPCGERRGFYLHPADDAIIMKSML